MAEDDEATVEFMRKLYARLAADEGGMASECAHPFVGEGPYCEECQRGPTHPVHDPALIAGAGSGGGSPRD